MVPLTVVVLLKKMGLCRRFLALTGVKEERLIPYIMTVVCFGGTAWFYGAKGACRRGCRSSLPEDTVAALINMIINFKWKISSHAAGIAGIVAPLICIEKTDSPGRNCLAGS